MYLSYRCLYLIPTHLTLRFWAHGKTTATPEAARHFVETFTDYLHSLITQAAERESDTIRTVDSYLKTRRQNIGVRPSYFPGKLHLSIPDVAFYHEVIKKLQYLSVDLVILDNVRLCSFVLT